MKKIRREFFQRDPLACARELVGCELVWNDCGGIIVETEAYSVLNDEACHTFARPSSREFVAERPPGTASVYLNYGIHWLLSFLVKGGAEDGFVLICALEPTRGIETMKRRRATHLENLSSGPRKLTRALGSRGETHGLDFFSLKSASLHLPARPPSMRVRASASPKPPTSPGASSPQGAASSASLRLRGKNFRNFPCHRVRTQPASAHP